MKRRLSPATIQRVAQYASMGGSGKATVAAASEAERDRAEIKEIHQNLTTALRWAERKGYPTIAADLRRCLDFARALKNSR
jgi:hypothetical protein